MHSELEPIESIAIVGMAARYLGAGNVAKFWENVCGGVESIAMFSVEELLEAGNDPALISQASYVRANRRLGDYDKFDAAFFDIPPREAEILDPQFRLFLEYSWEALEDAGYDPETFKGGVGVFAGIARTAYLFENIMFNYERLASSVNEWQIILGNHSNYLTNRVSYKLNLRGPSVNVQTACSTALVATHLACQNLLTYQCDMSLAGGVSVVNLQKNGYIYQEGGLLSPDGHCRPFDAQAHGTIFTDGIGVVVLKRLSDALADGDHIYALIKGSAVNNDGSLRVGFTAPSATGQAEVISMACAAAGVDPETISYVEAHGSGTPMGDPIEIDALTQVFREYTAKKQFCAIGSVKSNIGHTDAAAGAAGLIKTALALKHQVLPPSINYETANPQIDFAGSPFYVNTALREWQTTGAPRRAGVSSFGMGGTNAHAVLEEAPEIEPSGESRPYQLLTLSAHTETALEQMTDNLVHHLQTHPDLKLADVAYTLHVGRRAFDCRRMLVCRGLEDAVSALEARAPERIVSSFRQADGNSRPIAFMLSGVGDHYVNMGRELYQAEPVFREAIDKCCDLLRPILEFDLRSVLYPAGLDPAVTSQQGLDLRWMPGRDEATRSTQALMSQADQAQPAVFAVEYALSQLLSSWGIVPDALIGYSLGEYVAACVAGVFSLEDALTLVARRAQMLDKSPAGGMVAVPLSEEQVQPFLHDSLCLAVVNGPGACVLAGSAEAITRLEQQLAEKGIVYRRLDTRCAIHSTLMEPIAAELITWMQNVQLNPPRIPYLSNVTGTWITNEEATDPGYWARHLCQTVQFGDGLTELLQDRERVLLEVGPGQPLGSFVKQHPACARERWACILPTLRGAYDQQSDIAFILDTLGKLWLVGCPTDWPGYYAGERRLRVSLPTYPFERERYWLDRPVSSPGMGGTNAHIALKEFPPLPPSGPSRPWHLLLLSARTEAALDQATENLLGYLHTHPDVALADVAYTLQAGRRTFEHRRMLVCRDRADAVHTLETGDPLRVLTHYQRPVSRSVAFMFPGVGDHYLHMGQELYETEPVFQAAFDNCGEILRPYLDKLSNLLYPERPLDPPTSGESIDLRAMLGRNSQVMSPQARRLTESAVAQPVVFVIEYALACLLMSWGVRPDALVGYSLGEYVAACLADVLSLEDALRLVAERAYMIQTLPPGRMVAVSLSEEAIQPFLSEEISLAIHSGQTACVLAGSVEAVERLEKQLTEHGTLYRSVEATHAFHTPMMESLIEQLTVLVQGVKLNPPRLPYCSNLTGTWITAEQATDPAYWAQHMCRPVRFFESLGELLKDDERILLEVGPGQTLGSFAKQHPTCTHAQVGLILPTLRCEYDRQSDRSFLLGTVGRLWMLGVEPNWSGFYTAETRRRIPLPAYPFNRQSYTLDVESQRSRSADIANMTYSSPIEAISALPRQELDDWFYLPSWKQTAPHVSTWLDEAAMSGRCWLLFVDSCGLGTTLAGRLVDHGQSVVIVRAGIAFGQIDERQYVINPQARSDYSTLMNRLSQQGQMPAKIVHMWSVTDNEAISDEAGCLERMLGLGFYSLIYLAQAIGETSLDACDLSVVSSHVQSVTESEVICPPKAAVMGPCRVLPLEYANLTCRSIDVLPAGPDKPWGGALLDNMLGELTSNSADMVVALRGRQRWAETFEPFSLSLTPATSPSPLRPQGVYLITGGLGGIGMAIAEQLAQAVRARLVLLSRSALPPRVEWPSWLEAKSGENNLAHKIRQIQRLEELGAQVLVVSADVANEAQMQAALQETISRFGALHGVIHAAGVPGIGLSQLKTFESAASVLRPKVMGTIVLDHVLARLGLTPDFMVLFSSTAAIIGGGPGQVDYCAANAFLDAWARSRAQGKQKVIAINWCEWKWNTWDTGLKEFGDEVRTMLVENRKWFGIGFDEGYAALMRVLARDLPQVIVSTQDFGQVARVSQMFTAANVMQRMRQEPRPQHPRPALGVSYVAPSGDLECKIAAIWSELLGVAEVGANDNFFDLGGNSLIGINLISRIQRELGIKTLPAHVLYEASSVRVLAAYLSQNQETEKEAAEMLMADLDLQSEKRRTRLQERGRRASRRVTEGGNA